MAEREQHKALHWVEANYPEARGSLKAALIMAYGSGLDAGLAEAQEILVEEARLAFQKAARGTGT
jgi:hypothetical protein